MSAAAEQTALAVPRGQQTPRGVPGVSTGQLCEMLGQHFIRPGEELPGAVYLTEVTAPGSSRRADAVHIATWASRGGGEIDVCEIKTQRSDWLRELRDPGKAEAWWPYSSRYWLVVPNADVAKLDELPPGWGLMMPKRSGRRFQVVVKPAVRAPKVTPELLVALLTRTETNRINALRRQREQLERQYQQRLKEMQQEAAPALSPEVQERLRLLGRLEQALGGRLTPDSSWGRAISAEETAAALAAFVGGQVEQERALQRVAQTVRILSLHGNELTTALEKLRTGVGLPDEP
ncbi:hypothetical protein [Streptomyces ipomoeae]|uniref:hypothetical protein n=1 Tax=Streptomyces ipomoeae TaxID=103232 RepID=UPI0011472A85|nr:hypothetical protein [Streptomyces ipomoeae]TQE33149.1 hypothetical protein Sipo7851_21900 [Streptomyces ipomoeae]